MNGPPHEALDTRFEMAWLTEERAILTVEPEPDFVMGDQTPVIPNHVCRVINLRDSVTLIDSSGVTGKLAVKAHGKRR